MEIYKENEDSYIMQMTKHELSHVVSLLGVCRASNTTTDDMYHAIEPVLSEDNRTVEIDGEYIIDFRPYERGGL